MIEPRGLDELLPEWRTSFKDDPAPMNTEAVSDEIQYLTQSSSWPLPKPPQMRNTGNYIASLSEVVGWLGRRAAEDYTVDIFSGFGARDILYSGSGSDSGTGSGSGSGSGSGAGSALDKIIGVVLNDVGVSKSGEQKANYEPGMAVKAKVTLLAEGCHGSLAKKVIERHALRKGKQHQTYGIGLKEVWRVSKERHRKGHVLHTLGYPLTGASTAYGGGFLYHYENDLVSLGLVVGLDYANPNLSPYREFQKYKLHPRIKSVLDGGECVAYGARALNEGGFQSIPKLVFPGGMLIGCSAGFVNVPKIKGTHNAMKSGTPA